MKTKSRAVAGVDDDDDDRERTVGEKPAMDIDDGDGDDDDDDTDDEDTRSVEDSEERVSAYDEALLARSVGQAALDMLGDVSMRAATSPTPTSSSEHQLVELQQRLQRDQAQRSMRASSRAMLAKVTLSENVKLLERIGIVDEAGAATLHQTRLQLDRAQRIEQGGESWAAMSLDEVTSICDRLADESVAQFLNLLDHQQRLQARDNDRKLTILLRTLRLACALVAHVKHLVAQRREAAHGLVQDALGTVGAPLPDDIVDMVQRERALCLNDQIVAQVDEWIDKEVHGVMQLDVPSSVAEATLSSLVSKLHSLADREKQRIVEQRDLAPRYASALRSLLVMSPAERQPIVANPVFEPGICEGGVPPAFVARTPRLVPATVDVRQPMTMRPTTPIPSAKFPKVSGALRHHASESAFRPKPASSSRTAPVETARTGGVPVPAPVMTPLAIVSAAAHQASTASASAAPVAPGEGRPMPKDFTSVRCASSTDQVTRYVCRCTFDNDEPFEWYYMVYAAKNQRELEFPYSPTQQLSVVLPQGLFVVDSICECISTEADTVVSLKSKKKSFFRALTNLGYAFKMQAKRMKKFQKQAWCATKSGTIQWIRRVRTFSTNTLQITDAQLENLIAFIENRVVPIVEQWGQIERAVFDPAVGRVVQ
ncbi:PH domain-containing protein [Plasmodiophora brassicae]